MASEDIFFIIIGIIFIIILLIATFFSSTIVIIIICNWHSHCRSVSNLLTVNSCIAFLVFSITVSIQVPYLFQSNEKENDDRYTTFCRIRAYLFLFTCVTKVLSYFIQAVSRYFITILYKHKQLLTYRVNVIMIILNWIVGLIIASGFLISPVALQYEPESRLCILTSKVFHTSFTLMVVAFVIPVSIIVALYVHILRHTTRANRVQPSTITSGNNKRNLKVFQNILMLLAIVITGGTPYLLSIIINKIAVIPWPLYSIGVLFITLSAAVESVTIFLTNKEVKRICYAKIGFRQAEKMQVFTVGPTVNGLAKSYRIE
jgi:hypothetical protein